MTRRRTAALLLLAVVLLAATAWWSTRRQAAVPDVQRTDEPAALAADAPASAGAGHQARVLGAASAEDAPALRLEVTELRRPTRDVVEIRFVLVNADAERPLRFGDRFAESAAESGTVSGAALGDDAGATRSYVLRDPEGKPACSSGADVLAPGERRPGWVRFGTPGRATAGVTLEVPGLPPIAGLPLPPAS